MAFSIALILWCTAIIYVVAIENQTVTFDLFTASLSQKRFLVLLPCILGGVFLLVFRYKETTGFLFRYRWPLAVVLVTVCTLLEISGSSIGLITNSLGGSSDTIFGINRPIRSDEWQTNTPMALSQCVNLNGTFQYFSETVRATATDMFIVYGQPVWDIAEIFRPTHWGYLLLGAAKGLSFFWCSRLIFLFIVSFEFAYRILCVNHKTLSTIYAFMVALSPLVQWWFAINGLVEMLLFGQLAFVFLDLYLKTNSYIKRFFLALGIAWCLGIFTLVFYPAWQVPFAYVFIALLAAVLIKRLPQTTKDKRDIVIILVAFGILCAFLAYIVLKSWGTIQIELNTAYPGKRISTGGNAWSWLFFYINDLFTPFSSQYAITNQSEDATFFTLFPLSFILPLYLALKTKQQRAMVFALGIVVVFFGLYLTVGVPEIVAQASLLGRTTTNRVISAITYALILMLFATIPLLPKHINLPIIVIAIASGIIASASYYFIAAPSAKMTLVVIGVLTITIMGILMFHTQKCVAAISLIGITLICGALVNPVITGLNELTNNEVIKAIQDVNTSDDEWATINTYTSENNVPLIAGAKAINSTNVYPALSRWKVLDSDGTYNEIYNRYAHIYISLSHHENSEAVFSLRNPDCFEVTLNANQLKEIGATKILSADGELEHYSTSKTSIKLIQTVNDHYLYTVETS